NGKLILRDFHPFSKVVDVSEDDGFLVLKESYIDKSLSYPPVADEGFFPKEERGLLPNTYLRKWPFSAIITTFVPRAFSLKKMYEEPNKYNQFIPANFMIVAIKSNEKFTS